MPERAVLDGFQFWVVLEEEERRYTHQNGHRTGNGEKCDVAALRVRAGEILTVNEHTADERADKGADNGQGCGDCAYLTGV